VSDVLNKSKQKQLFVIYFQLGQVVQVNIFLKSAMLQGHLSQWKIDGRCLDRHVSYLI